MKTLFFTLLFVAITTMNFAQKELTWYTNIEDAAKISSKTGKPMFLFFTGSDWCGWCVKLQKEVFKTPEFEAWAKDNVVLVDVDFPRDKSKQSMEIQKQNALIGQQFAVQGYPTVHFVTGNVKDGQVNFEKQLGKSGYMAGGPINWINNANTYLLQK